MSELVKKCERCGKEINSFDNENSNVNYEESNKIKEHVESQYFGCASRLYTNDGFKMWQKIGSRTKKTRTHCGSCAIFIALVEKFGNKKKKRK